MLPDEVHRSNGAAKAESARGVVPVVGFWLRLSEPGWVVDLTRENTHQLLGREVKIVVASAYGIQENYNCSLEQWLSEHHLRVLGREELVVKIAQGKQEWVVASAAPPN